MAVQKAATHIAKKAMELDLVAGSVYKCFYLCVTCLSKLVFFSVEVQSQLLLLQSILHLKLPMERSHRKVS